MLNVNSQGRRVRRKVVKNIHQDSLRQVQAPFKSMFDVAGALGRNFESEIGPGGQARRRPAIGKTQDRVVAYGSEAQEDAGFKTVEALNQPHDVIGIKQNLGCKKA